MPTLRPKLLYIDDDVALARLVQKDLQRHGYEVHHASDGDAGLVRLRAERYDVVALDHYMPQRDGLDVLPDIQAMEEAPPVIFVTGAQESRLAIAALKAGAFDYVVKDASGDFAALLRVSIAQALEADRLRREKEQAEADVRAARDHAEALLREVNHRVGNSLQLVSSFVALQARSLSDDTARAALTDTQARIEAVAQVHRRLYTSADVEAVEMKEYLSDLIEQLSQSLSADSRGVVVTLEATPVRVATDRAVSLGVIVTELVTNAVKYAYPEGPGEIRVRLTSLGDGEAELAVTDDGPGFRLESAPKGGGLGRMIVKAMAASLKTEVSYGDGPGAEARLRFATA
jgi:two-component sensor histidine kinase